MPATQTKKSLHKRHDDLAQANKQLEVLSGGIFADGELPTFNIARSVSMAAKFLLCCVACVSSAVLRGGVSMN